MIQSIITTLIGANYHFEKHSWFLVFVKLWRAGVSLQFRSNNITIKYMWE